jgi:hypothetical protein
MHTPSAALTWELWRKHRTRLIGIIGLVLAFAVVYPKLCALAGFDLNSADPLQEFARMAGLGNANGVSLFKIVQSLYLLFLVCGPAVTMLMTLLYVIWMFTFTEPDQKTKDSMKFPARLFTLPVSTPFLFWWIFLAGLTAVMALYASWVYVVPHPHIETFGLHENIFGWMTLLAVTQAIVWALAAWPITRMLVLIAVFFGFIGTFEHNIFQWPIVLPLGAVLARAGLQKMRHGQWQGWSWKWLANAAARAEWRGPKRFASPTQAQLWFEWRRFMGNACFLTVALALVPVALHVLVRVVFGLGPLEVSTMWAFSVGLVWLPVFIHFCFGMSPIRRDQSFLMVRPLDNGGMIMPMLKTAAISAVVSWVAVLAALSAMPLLGDFSEMERLSPLAGCRAALVLGLIFLTWRMIAANLCFMLPGSRWIATVPTLMFVAFAAAMIMFFTLEENGAYWHPLSRILPILLVCLVAVKFLLAFLSFGISLKRRLLAPDVVVNYLTVWILLVVALLATMVFLSRPPKELIFPFSLGVVLLVPLARIGFCPIMLARFRHA